MFLLDKIIDEEHQSDFRVFLDELRLQENAFLLRDQVIEEFEHFCEKNQKDSDYKTQSELRKLIDLLQEIVFHEEYSYLVTRRRIGETAIYGIPRTANRYEKIPVDAYLQARDAIVLGAPSSECDGLEIDMDPFITSPLIKDSRNIGQGITIFSATFRASSSPTRRSSSPSCSAFSRCTRSRTPSF